MIRKIIALILIAFFFLVAPVFAGVQFIYPKFQGFDNNGNPLSGGLLYTYAANSTTVKATYSDRILITPNTNPVVLNSRGEAVVYGAGQYKFVLKDATGSIIWTFDYLDGIGGYLGGNFYFPDAGQADQGVAVGSVTVKDFVDAIGATKTATIVFSRGSTGNTTDYTFLTSETIPSNINCQFEQGARVSIAITKTLTLHSPANIIAQPNQQIKIGAGTLAFTNLGKIPPGWVGFSISGSAAVNAAAIQEVMAMFSDTKGGMIELPGGSYAVAPDVIDFTGKRGVELRGAGAGYGYNQSTPGTTFIFTAGSIGINMYDPAALGTGTMDNAIKSLKIDGNDLCDEGIKANGNQVIEDVTVIQFNDYGIHLANYTNSAVLNRVNLYDNVGDLGYGLFVDGQYTTAFYLTNVVSRTNKIGARFQAGVHVSIRNSCFESNTAEGLYFHRPGTTTGLDGFLLENVWLENNYSGAGTGYSIVFDSTTPGGGDEVPAYFRFVNCRVTASAAGKHLNVNRGRQIEFDKCIFGSGDLANGVLLNSSYANYVYAFNGIYLTPVAAGRQWTTQPTGYVSTSVGNKTYQLSKSVDQEQSAGPTTIFTISGFNDGDAGDFQVSISGSFPGEDSGGRLYYGMYYRTGGAITVFIYPIRLALAASAITDPADTPASVDALRDDLVANTIPSIESIFDITDARAGNYTVLTAVDSGGSLLIRLTTGDWAGVGAFTGAASLTLSSRNGNLSVN